MPKAHIERLSRADVSVNGTSLRIFLIGDQETYTMKMQGPAAWECEDQNELKDTDTVEFKDGYLIWSCSDGVALLHCRDGELHFARSWGQLLCAADKYCVNGLVDLCANRMRERLSVWSAATMLQYACSANQEQLKRDIMGFITLTDDMCRSVRDMPEFDSLSADLQAEITDVLLERGCPRGTKRKEFADEQDWGCLSAFALRRACVERGLATSGGPEVMAALLHAQHGSSS